ncbi:MAG TPA: tetratricopeptide repeat protein, partial [Candidatus Binatia bacterium]|nr:tetratricopeptide repeat protein [Candidatus Binatia bacterium]
YRARGEFERAEGLYLRSLSTREKLLGRDHPDVGTTLKNLAELYRNQGRAEEAKPLYQRALNIMETALGKDHPEAVEMRSGYTRLPAKSQPTSKMIDE